MVYRLDGAFDQKGLTKTERRIISELIPQLVGDLIEECDDAQLKVIYNKHSQSDYDREAAAELEDMKLALEAVLGVELGDDIDMSSPDEVLQRARMPEWKSSRRSKPPPIRLGKSDAPNGRSRQNSSPRKPSRRQSRRS